MLARSKADLREARDQSFHCNGKRTKFRSKCKVRGAPYYPHSLDSRCGNLRSTPRPPRMRVSWSFLLSHPLVACEQEYRCVYFLRSPLMSCKGGWAGRTARQLRLQRMARANQPVQPQPPHFALPEQRKAVERISLRGCKSMDLRRAKACN
jgi:hypothetical protein